MGLLDSLSQMVSSAAGLSGADVDHVTGNASPDALGSALANAFKSDGTPPIGELVGQLFGNSNDQQRAGLLNQIIASVGPAAAAALGGGVLGRLLQPGAEQVTPAQASQLSPEDVQAVVNHAHEANPEVADALGNFYAQHSGLIKTLGGAALVMVVTHLSGRKAE